MTVLFDNYDEEMDWEILNDILDNFFDTEGDYGFLICGTVGRWNGTYDGGKYFNSAREFWRTGALEDCGYVKLYDENGHMFINGSHHDGSNHFEVKMLTRKGKDLLEKWNYDYDDKRTEREIHQIIMKSNLFSKLPKLATIY